MVAQAKFIEAQQPELVEQAKQILAVIIKADNPNASDQ